MALIAGEKGLALGHVTINEVVSKIRGCLKSVLLRQPPPHAAAAAGDYPYFSGYFHKLLFLDLEYIFASKIR